MNSKALLGLALGMSVGAIASVVMAIVLMLRDRQWQPNIAWAIICLLGAILCAVLRLQP